MKISYVNYSRKGQIKIQEMAFVLVAIVILFVIAALFYLSIRMSGLRESAQSIYEEQAREAVRKLASSPELTWTSTTCSSCVDFDKIMALKNMSGYNVLWDLDYLRIDKLYPKSSGGECTEANYPDCSNLTIIQKEHFGSPSSAFISLCRYEKGGYEKCELGKIYAAKNIKE